MRVLLHIDLETYDTEVTAKVISIAVHATVWNEVTNSVAGVYEFYAPGINPDACLNSYRTSDADTLAWWEKQKAENPVAWDAVKDFKLELKAVITSMLSFIEDIAVKHSLRRGDILAIGNGPEFDLSILNSIFKAAAVDAPWEFWNQHSSRTLSLCMTMLGLPKLSSMLPYEAGHHTADYDAKVAAARTMRALAILAELKGNSTEAYINATKGANT